MKKLVFGFVFVLIFMPTATLAAAGDNCAIDIVSGASDTISWENNFMLKGHDGSAWQRAVITSPNDTIEIEELKPVKIQGNAISGSEVYVFIFASQKNAFGGIMQPSEGTCFETGSTDASGYFSLDFNAGYLWGNINDKIIIDAFYKLDQTWDELQKKFNGSNATYVTTYLPPQEVEVHAVVNAGDGIGLLPLPPDPPNGPSGPDNGTTNPNPTIAPPQGVTPVPGGQGGIPVRCPSLCGGQEIVAMRLDPAATLSSISGRNFDAVGGKPVVIGRLPGPHTFYSGFADRLENSIHATRAEFQPLALNALSMEVIKRGLMGKPNFNGVSPGIDTITASTLTDAANGRGNASERTKKIAFLIRSIMVRSENNQANEVAIPLPPPPPPPPQPTETARPTTGPTPTNSTIPAPTATPTPSTEPNPSVKPTISRGEAIKQLKAIMPQSDKVDFNKLFPEHISEADWANTFLQMLTFWTGGGSLNTCLMVDDNLVEKNFFTSKFKGTGCKLDNSNGISPTILLHTKDAITLTPAFNDTKIVFTTTPFSSGKEWVLPAGDKSALAYRYRFTSPFTNDRAGSMCVKKSSLSSLLSGLSETYALDTKESATLTSELTTEFPLTDDFVQLSLARPADIAARFHWLGDGKPLSLLQLFFELTPNGCSAEALDPPAFEIPVDRDGFETGIIR